ncbi:DUF1292 domain-containing protein [Clostridium tarantellae]|uniref:UPF0473 protein GBZ86_04920 n=1 Tax=Clostridium tarantellae TaxID=39493 RepID=A0A6I1MLI7_9CLOT|nr:DUF1292 domain-containing protein [Clostridium tarantellae]MPQ43102.1 DUF1292 domain-containing protein [Clostridium tarantellae]
MNDDLKNIVLMDEEGVETEFTVVTKLDMEENEYFLLSPIGEDDVVIAMKVVVDEDGNEILAPVESDFELEMIEEAYATLFAEEE